MSDLGCARCPGRQGADCPERFVPREPDVRAVGVLHCAVEDRSQSSQCDSHLGRRQGHRCAVRSVGGAVPGLPRPCRGGHESVVQHPDLRRMLSAALIAEARRLAVDARLDPGSPTAHPRAGHATPDLVICRAG